MPDSLNSEFVLTFDGIVSSLKYDKGDPSGYFPLTENTRRRNS